MLASRAWRDAADWPFVQVAQAQCFWVMRQLGYTLFRHESDLRHNDTLGYSQASALLGVGARWIV